jgi:hypothetical protein
VLSDTEFGFMKCRKKTVDAFSLVDYIVAIVLNNNKKHFVVYISKKASIERAIAAI